MGKSKRYDLKEAAAIVMKFDKDKDDKLNKEELNGCVIHYLLEENNPILDKVRIPTVF